jgi:hypothetical protein
VSTEFTFKGSYRYDSAKTVKRAIASVRELLAEEDDDLPDPFEDGELVDDGLTIKVDVDTSAPSDWFFVYESLVETLASLAESGSVTSTQDGDESDTYPAGADEDDEP